MRILKAIVKTVVEIPIAVVKDVVTLGGVAVGNSKLFTQEKYEEIMGELD